MKRVTVLAALLALVLATAALAQPGGYDLTWNAVGGGGATAITGGAYQLSGTAGRPEAGALSGASYSLSGGFWGLVGGFATQYRVYVPLAPKNASGW